MKKKFLSNLFLLIILNILIKPFWFFGIEVAVQNQVGEEMYGFYFSLFNFAFILNIILDLGITNFNNRAIAREHGLLHPYLSSIVPLKFLLSIVYAVFVFGAGLLIGYSSVQFRLLLFLVFNQFLSSFILYMRSNISGLQLFRTDSLLSVLDRTLMIFINGVLLWTSISKQAYRIEWFVYSQSISYFLTLIIVTIVVLCHSGKIRLNFNSREFITILKQSYPFALLILLMSFFNRADSVMIERLLPDGKEQAGIYAQSFRILDALSQFSLLFAGLLLPMFSKMLKTGEKVDELINISSSLLLSLGLSVIVAGSLFNKEIITLLYHEVNEMSPRIFSILMGGFVFISLSYVYGTLLTANRNLKQLNILAGITVFINIGLNFVLIPSYKAYGAAIASLSSQGFYAMAQFVLSHRYIKLKFSGDRFIRLLIYGILLCAIGYFLNRYLAWIPAIIIFAAMAILSAFLSGVIKPMEFIRVFRKEKSEDSLFN